MEFSYGFLIGAIITIVFITTTAIAAMKISTGLENININVKFKNYDENIQQILSFLFIQAEGSSKTYKLNILEGKEVLCFFNATDLVEKYENNELNKLDVIEYDTYTLEPYDLKNIEVYIRNYENFEEPIPTVYYRYKGKGILTKNYDILIPDESFCIFKPTKLYFENKGEYISVSPILE